MLAMSEDGLVCRIVEHRQRVVQARTVRIVSNTHGNGVEADSIVLGPCSFLRDCGGVVFEIQDGLDAMMFEIVNTGFCWPCASKVIVHLPEVLNENVPR